MCTVQIYRYRYCIQKYKQKNGQVEWSCVEKALLCAKVWPRFGRTGAFSNSGAKFPPPNRARGGTGEATPWDERSPKASSTRHRYLPLVAVETCEGIKTLPPTLLRWPVQRPGLDTAVVDDTSASKIPTERYPRGYQWYLQNKIVES